MCLDWIMQRVISLSDFSYNAIYLYLNFASFTQQQ